jgi:acyl-CoA thioesterase-2
MPDVLNDLIDRLRLERIESNHFRGQSQDLGWGAMFGGQVLGQALSAASQTVAPERLVHSLHAAFLRPGDVSAPVLYEVDRLRDGGSFSARRVLAIQGGEPLFSLMASFMTPEEGFDHQTAPPDVPPPEALKNERQLAIELAERYPAARPMIKVASGPIEMRPVQPLNYLEPQPMPARRQIWYRTVGPLPDDPLTHRALLAYASDFNFLVTAMLPHGVTWVTPGMQVTSHDHAMGFPRPCRFDEWLLYDLESPSAHGGRGVVRGRFYTRDGVLAASVVQEGLMRDRSRARRT